MIDNDRQNILTGSAVPKLVVGLLLGVAVTLVIVFLLDEDFDPRSDASVDLGPSTGNRTEPEARTFEEAVAKEDEQTVVDRSDRNSIDTESSLTVSPEQNQSTSAPRTGSPLQTPAKKIPPATHEGRDYPPEIAEILEDVDPELQSWWESEEREESWATYMEGQLTSYFAQKPELAQFNFSLIDCRTSICEIHALGYGPDALTRWTTGTADLVAQTWHDFTRGSVSQHNPQPDTLGIVLILARNPTE